jgi:hypothetical protein
MDNFKHETYILLHEYVLQALDYLLYWEEIELAKTLVYLLPLKEIPDYPMLVFN